MRKILSYLQLSKTKWLLSQKTQLMRKSMHPKTVTTIRYWSHVLIRVLSQSARKRCSPLRQRVPRMKIRNKPAGTMYANTDCNHTTPRTKRKRVLFHWIIAWWSNLACVVRSPLQKASTDTYGRIFGANCSDLGIFFADKNKKRFCIFGGKL